MELGEDAWANFNPWVLSETHIKLSCLTDDVKSGRHNGRKRRSFQSAHKSSMVPKEDLKVRNVLPGDGAMKRVKRQTESLEHGAQGRRRRDDHEEVEVEGVIYMVKAYYGKDYYSSCSKDKSNDYCQMNAFDDKEFMIQCNGAHRCWILGIPAWLADCGFDSDFLHVEYQCVPGSCHFFFHTSIWVILLFITLFQQYRILLFGFYTGQQN